MANMSVKIASVKFKNPVIAASGTFGFGREYSEFYPVGRLGGIAVKGLTLKERPGNPPVRVAETPAGMLNSIGLQNPGVDAFIEHELPWLRQQNTVVIANAAGSTLEEYREVVMRLSDSAVDMIELNISCPNVKQGGMSFGSTASSVEEVVSTVRAVCKKPLVAKLSPNVTDIVEIARAAESAGADAISLINTLLGMRIDINSRRPILKNNVGGLSGAAVFPIALRMVWEVASKVSVPVIGLGGIIKWQDAMEMMLAGASAVQVGTANFTDPFACVKIIDGLENYLIQNNIEDINDIVGKVKPW